MMATASMVAIIHAVRGHVPIRASGVPRVVTGSKEHVSVYVLGSASIVGL